MVACTDSLIDVGEDVDAARGLEHVVQEAASAAGVDVAQRAALAAEHQQRRAASAAAGVRCRTAAMRALDARGDRVGLRRRARSARPSARIVAVMSARPPWR